MLYLAIAASKMSPATSEFSQRGLNMAPTQLSKFHFFGVPNGKQIAFSGYKDNIDAFLYAMLFVCFLMMLYDTCV